VLRKGCLPIRASQEAGAALAMPVPEAERDWPPRSRPGGARHDALLDHALTGRADAATALRGGEHPEHESQGCCMLQIIAVRTRPSADEGPVTAIV
jgi:hypothetical protein